MLRVKFCSTPKMKTNIVITYETETEPGGHGWGGNRGRGIQGLWGSKGVYVQISWATERGKIFIQIGYANKLRQSHTTRRSRARCRAKRKTEHKLRMGWCGLEWVKLEGSGENWGKLRQSTHSTHPHDMRLRPGARTAAGHNEVWARLNEMSTAAWR